jgi:AcrR family transcriptional regulator
MPNGSYSPYPHTKVTRANWLDAARDLAVREGMSAVKVMTLADALGVSRSSFYWYFKNRSDLLDQMLSGWQSKNTPAIVERAGRASPTINRNILAIAECWFDPELFDPRLDFVIREWARRSPEVRAEVDRADTERVTAITDMFKRHGYEPTEAFIRARILYFTQIGYYALDVTEPMETRKAYAAEYLRGFSGVEPVPGDLADLEAFIVRIAGAR